MKQGCWCISLSLFSQWTCHRIATFPMSLLGGPPRWRPSTMCNHAVLHHCTLPNSLLCHARSPRIGPSLRMTLLLMGLWGMFLLQRRHNPFLLWSLLANFLCPQHLLWLSHLLTCPHLTFLTCLLTFGCLQIRSTLLLVCQSLFTLPLHVTQRQCSSPPSLAAKSSNSSIILIPFFQVFVCVTLQTTQTLRCIGLRRKFIGLWVVKIFGITSTSYRLVGMLDGLTVASLPPSLGSFATIPKVKHDQSLDHTHYLYLDAVHVSCGCHFWGISCHWWFLICLYSGGQGHLV
jgi:hypothetical protein